MSGKSSPDTLTGLQQLWAEHYLQCLDQTEAARRAGYKATNGSLKSLGYQNAQKPHIKAYLAERWRSIHMDSDECMARIASHARGNLGDLEEALKAGSAAEVIAKAREKGVSHLIRKISETANGITVELHSPQRALELIGKHLGVLTDRVELSGSVDVTKLSNEELEKLAGRG